MYREMLSDRFRITARNTITNIVLVTNAFVWYYLVIRILDNISIKIGMVQFTTLMWSVHFAGIVFSAIAGASLANKVGDRTRFLMLWMSLGAATSLVSLVVDTTYVPNVLALSLLWGVSLGLGMPSCMGYFTKSIQIENRARVGGIMLLLSGLGFAAFGTTAAEDIGLQTFILSAWRIFGLVSFLALGHKMENPHDNKSSSYKSLFGQRTFLLYLVPWVMFSLITYLTIPVQTQIIESMQARMPNVPSVEFLRGIENVLIGVFAVVGGFLSDIVGRKRTSIVAFALLGIAYSILGIYPENTLSWYFYTIIDGVSWGMLYVVFVVTIWGDLGNHLSSEKYYAVGVAPFWIAKYFQFTIGTDIANAISNSAIFSFTALFLFLAVLPLIYAPETLPEKTMKDRELKIYIEKAEKIREKYA
jgi:MFS family permease